ncbi:MAG: hypothetical protein A4E66_02411 [Syntrophus sp. PtaB.Bin001]|nr:MAG: hypothetical protein A4E66_02411 [Syntrophus sp. PtaB.Bin001]
MAGTVHLIDDVEDLFPRFSQQLGNFNIRRGQAVPAIHQENDEIGLFYSQVGLFTHLDEDGLRGCGLEAARVDQGVFAPVPVAFGIIAVPCCPRHVDDDGLAFL